MVRYNPADDPSTVEEMLAQPEAASPAEDAPLTETVPSDVTTETPETIPDSTLNLTPRTEGEGTGAGPKVLEPPKEEPKPSEPAAPVAPAPSQAQPAEEKSMPEPPPPPAFVPDA